MKRATRLLGWVLLGAIGLEAIARVHLFGLAGLHPLRVDSVKPIFEAGLLVPSDDPEIGFELRPRFDGWFKLARLRTSSRGLRYRELGTAKPEGVFRVAVVGSSFTLPSGVALEDAYHARLERSFSERFAPRRFEFVNFAVGAHHPLQMVALLEHRALAYDPDLILFALTPLSAPAALGRYEPVPRGPEPVTHPFFGSFLVDLVRLRLHGPEPLALDASALRPRRGPDVAASLGRIGRARGTPVVVVRLEFGEPEASAADEEVRERVLAEGLQWVDTRAAFRGADPRRYWIHPLDPHPNAEAHAVFADVIGEVLVERGLVGPAPVSSPGTRTAPPGASR